MDCSPSGSSVHWISQASILEWVVVPSPGDLAHLGIEPTSPALTGGFFSIEPPEKPCLFVCGKRSFDRPANYNCFLSHFLFLFYLIFLYFSQSGLGLSPGYWWGAVGGEKLHLVYLQGGDPGPRLGERAAGFAPQLPALCLNAMNTIFSTLCHRRNFLEASQLARPKVKQPPWLSVSRRSLGNPKRWGRW